MTPAQLRRVARPKPYYVYVIAWSPRGPSKIGITDGPVMRLAELQVGNPYRLRIYAALNVGPRGAALRVEAAVLDEYRALRLIGEWIKVSPVQLSDGLRLICRSLHIDAGTWQATAAELASRQRILSRPPRETIRRVEDAYEELRRLQVR